MRGARHVISHLPLPMLTAATAVILAREVFFSAFRECTAARAVLDAVRFGIRSTATPRRRRSPSHVSSPHGSPRPPSPLRARLCSPPSPRQSTSRPQCRRWWTPGIDAARIRFVDLFVMSRDQILAPGPA